MPWTDNSPAWTNIESPFKGFQEGLQTGVSLGSIAIQRQASELKLKQQAQQLAESSLAMTAQEQTMQYNLETHRRALDIQQQTQAGQSEFAGAVADIANDGDWTNPSARSRVFDVAKRYPTIMDTPAWQHTMDNFVKSDKASAEATKWQGQATIAQQRADALQQQVDIAKAKEDLAEKKFNATQNPDTIKYETPFENMPWIKIAHTANGGIHVIRGEQPLNATQKLEMIKARAKANEELGYIRDKKSAAAVDLQKQLDYIDETMKGAQTVVPGPTAPVDNKDPLGLFK